MEWRAKNMTPIIGDLITNTVGKVVGKLADKYLPSTMGEVERAEFQKEAQRLAVEEYKIAAGDAASARELAGKESDGAPGWTKILTVTHRPAWSFLVLGIFAWTIAAPYLGWPVIPLSDVHKEVMIVVITFYFGGRSLEKIVSMIRDKEQ